MRLLLVVDVQNDFCPGGKLAVPEGDRVIPVINDLMEQFSLVLASQDWHPEDSSHFEKWPPHCVRNTEGARLHPKLNQEKIDQYLKKGVSSEADGYSVFETENIDLDEFLEVNNVQKIFITGLATEHCVRHSALEAARRGFSTYVVCEAVSGIDEEEIELAKEEMKEAGVQFVSASEISSK